MSESDAGSISSKGIIGPTFKASTIVGNGQSAQNCGGCGSDSVNANSAPHGDKVLIQGPSATSSISGPSTAVDNSGSGSSEQGYYATLPNGQDHKISADCDHTHSNEGSNLKNGYLPPVDNSKQGLNQHYRNDGAYNEHLRGVSVDIQGPSVHSTIAGPSNYDSGKYSNTPKPSSSDTSSFPSSSHTLSIQSGPSFPANHFDNGANAAENQDHSGAVEGSSSPLFTNGDGSIGSGNLHTIITTQTGEHSHAPILGVDHDSGVQSTNTDSDTNSEDYPEFSSIKATYIEPNQPSISPDYSHTALFPIPEKSSHKSGIAVPNGSNQNSNGLGVAIQGPSAYSTITVPQNSVESTKLSTDQGFSSSSLSSFSSDTSNNNGDGETSSHPKNVIVQDLGNSGDNKPHSPFGSHEEHNYYDSSSFAPPTYMRPGYADDNSAGNLQFDSQETGLSSFDSGASGSDYDCYILKLPLNTYAYIVPTDDSVFLKKLVQSAAEKPQIFYVHKSHHHHHQKHSY